MFKNPVFCHCTFVFEFKILKTIIKVVRNKALNALKEIFERFGTGGRHPEKIAMLYDPHK